MLLGEGVRGSTESSNECCEANWLLHTRRGGRPIRARERRRGAWFHSIRESGRHWVGVSGTPLNAPMGRVDRNWTQSGGKAP